MSAPFVPGDVVVCVDASPSAERYSPPELTEGAIYHVYAVGRDGAGKWGVFLDELESVGFAGGYLAYRFRKVDGDVTGEVRELLSELPVVEPVA